MANKENELNAIYMMVSSLEDLARCAFGSHTHIKAVKIGQKFRLLTDGEKITHPIIYFTDVDKIGKYLVYRMDNGIENAKIADSHPEEVAGYGTYAMPIIEISNDPYKKIAHPKMDAIKLVEVMDLDSMVRAFASNSYDDNLQRMYVFKHKKNNILGTFDLFRKRNGVFAYVSTSMEIKGVLEYNYSTDSVKSASIMTPGKAYIKVIHLSEPFPFFEGAKG